MPALTVMDPRRGTQAAQESVEGSFHQTTLWSLEPKMHAPPPDAAVRRIHRRSNDLTHAFVVLRSYNQLADPARLAYELANDFFPYICPEEARLKCPQKPNRSLPPLQIFVHQYV